jgi:hypothetical protein
VSQRKVGTESYRTEGKDRSMQTERDIERNKRSERENRW